MGIKLYNKNAARAEIAKEEEITKRTISGNDTKVQIDSNKTNLLTEIVKVVDSIARIFLTNSKKEGDQ